MRFIPRILTEQWDCVASVARFTSHPFIHRTVCHRIILLMKVIIIITMEICNKIVPTTTTAAPKKMPQINKKKLLTIKHASHFYYIKISHRFSSLSVRWLDYFRRLICGIVFLFNGNLIEANER